ncbi:tetratricopeptide repeat protein [Aliikangiella sp. IMCC44359]|uniref:tetratricopeptide repeat protein n=1 Tax=Aliikangiella sp. IMCC44359 TaxID=3459125 RepID=UPI00403B0BB4
MLLPSKKISFFTTVFLISVLSACSTLDKKPLPEQAKKAEQAEINDKTQSSKPDGKVNESINDPMKREIPLELVKGYDEVVSALKSSQAKAIAKLIQLNTKFPKQSGPSYRLAKIYYETKEYDKALSSLENCLKIEQNNYYALNLKGMVLREKGDFAKAKEAYLSSIKIYPNHPDTHINLGILADIYLYDLSLAQVHYQKYLDLLKDEDKKVAGWLIDLKRRAGN